MIKIMDDRAKARENQRQKEAVKKLEAATEHCCEANSQIIFKDKMRLVSDDQLTGLVGTRKFIKIEDIDKIGSDTLFEQKVGTFTVGVVVDTSTIKTSAKGTQFMIFVVSDLVRHDALKLNKSQEAAFKDRSKLKQA